MSEKITEAPPAPEAKSSLPAVERDPARVYLVGLARNTRVDVAGRLARSAALMGCADPRLMPWAQLRYEHVIEVKTRLVESGLAASTVNGHLSALRGVAQEAWNLRLMGAEDYHRIRGVKNVRGSRLLRGRALKRGEVAALFAACVSDRRPHGARDAALLAVLAGSGLRRGECAALDLDDYDPGAASLRVRRGKGNRERVVYLNRGAGAAIAAWLGVRGDEPGPLFCWVGNTTRVVLARITAGAMYAALRRRAPEAGVRPFSPHDLRRTFISDLLDAGADLATVQRLAGHASPATTERYDRRGDYAKRKAASLVKLPYPVSPQHERKT